MALKPLIILALTAAFGAVVGRLQGQAIHYPETRKVDQVDDYFGTKVADPYRWLEDTDSPQTAEWVKEENAVTFAYLDRLPQRKPLLERLTKLWNYPKYGIPFKEAGEYFFNKNDGLQNQSVLYVQPSLSAPPRALLDPNTLSKDGTIAVSSVSVSKDGKHLAYALSSGGSDWQEVHVREVATAQDRDDLLKHVKFSGLAWTRDNRGFFYSRYPAPDEKAALRAVNRNHKLYYHALGTPQSEDQLVYERPDQPDWSMGAEVTEDGRYAILYLNVGTDPKNRVYYMDLRDPNKPDLKASVVKLLDKFDAAYDFIGHDGPVFYFKTNLGAPRSKVIAIDVTKPGPENWRTLIPESKDLLESVSLIGNQFFARYLQDAYSAVRIYNMEGHPVKDLEFPTLGTVSGFSGKRTDKELFYAFTSFLYPTTIYRYDVATGKSTVLREAQIKVDAAPYETKQVFYDSKDGTRVPMFLVYRKGIKLDGTNPTYLYGYGGFDVSLTPYFSVSNLVWLENGGVYAMPNLRGGGEYGEEWHKAGTLEHKQNVFDDFIAAAEYLIKEGYTSPKKLAIAGASNGGLLVGAVLNQRPDLFGCALPGVGVMDMLRYNQFTIGWMWASDYGTSKDPKQFKTLYAYSPLHNIKPGTHYPPTLITTADHDDRVVPGHSFKYAATLQAAQGGDAPILIRIQTRAGHGAGKPTSKVLEELADQWAFVMHSLGMGERVAGGS